MSGFILEAISVVRENPLLIGIAASLIAAFIVWIVRRFIYGQHKGESSIELNQYGEQNEGTLSNVIGSGNIVSQTINYESIYERDDSFDDSFEKIDARRVVAQRLRDAIDLLNEDVCNEIDAIWVAKEVLGEESFAVVQSYLNAELAPPFSFLESFSSFFGISPEWLTYGRGNPFPLEYVYSLQEFTGQIIKANPIAVYFVLEKSEKRRALIVLGKSEYAYQVAGHSDWPLAICDSQGRQNVGATGLGAIVVFFDMIAFAHERYHDSFLDSSIKLKQISSIELDEKDWDSLVSGKRYPGSIIHNKRQDKASHWADDLRDLEQRLCGGSPYYEATYGKWFLETQNYIRKKKNGQG